MLIPRSFSFFTHNLVSKVAFSNVFDILNIHSVPLKLFFFVSFCWPFYGLLMNLLLLKKIGLV